MEPSRSAEVLRLLRSLITISDTMRTVTWLGYPSMTSSVDWLDYVVED
ncbi:MAG: hypothetical protein RR280_04270 [Bacteroidaceae bacterium]